MKGNKYILPVFVSDLGCPFQCIYCNQKKITGVSKKYDVSELEKYINENLSYYNDKTKPVQLAFYGGSFTGIDYGTQISYLKCVRKFIEKGLIESIRISTRPDYITKNILEYLLHYDVKTIELGVQSLNDNVLLASKRGHTYLDVKNASELIKNYGFELGHQIMPGLIGDNINTIKETLDKSISMKPDLVRIYPLLVLKDTLLEKMYLNNEYIPLTLEEAVEISTFLYKIYTLHNIKVIKIGLMNTKEINNNNQVITGPFSESFGYLVLSRYILNKLLDLLYKYDKIDSLEIAISSRYYSNLVGFKRKNIIYLKNRFKINDLKIKTINQEDMKIKINHIKGSMTCT